MHYLISGALLLLFFILTFAIAQLRKNNGYIDIVWGTGFIITSLTSYFLARPQGIVPIVMTIAVIIWGTRLTWHLARRNLGQAEDFRYAAMRSNWHPRIFYLRMFVQIYLLQFALNYIINLPVIVTNIQGNTVWGITAVIGLIIWLAGFTFETVADSQLKRFKARPENKGRLMTRGLWNYSRHPNYFGEAFQWWGIFIMSVSGNSNYWLILSPAVITLFLLFVSGVPMLEKKYRGRQDWEEYKQKTSKFFPWFPRR